MYLTPYTTCASVSILLYSLIPQSRRPRTERQVTYCLEPSPHYEPLHLIFVNSPFLFSEIRPGEVRNTLKGLPSKLNG